MSSLTSSEQSRGTPLGFSEDSGGSVLTDAWPADSKTDAWPADPEGAVLTPGGGRGAGVRSGAGGGEGGTDVGALDSFPILIVRPQSTAGCEAAQYSHSRPPGRPPGCRSSGRAGSAGVAHAVLRDEKDLPRGSFCSESQNFDEPKPTKFSRKSPHDLSRGVV